MAMWQHTSGALATGSPTERRRRRLHKYRMTGAVPLRPLYVFVDWTGEIFTFMCEKVEECFLQSLWVELF